jgi:hypothetical protein
MSLANTAEADLARPRSARIDRSLELRRLARNITTMITAHPRTTALGHDDIVEHIADQQGLGRALSIHRIVIGQRIRTLIGVPDRVQRHKASRVQLLALKHAAAAAGHPVILVPESFIQRQPRLSNLRMIEEASGVVVRAEHRIAVLMHLVETGHSTIIDCAAVVHHDTPISLLLRLVADGVIRISTNRPIGPHTRVDLVEAGAS